MPTGSRVRIGSTIDESFNLQEDISPLMQGAAAILAVLIPFRRRKKNGAPAQAEGGAFIRCPACQMELHNTIPRCPYCSAFLEVTCPNCDRTTNRNLIQCPYCGTSLRDEREKNP